MKQPFSSSLGTRIQVVLQTEQDWGGLLCEGFTGFPTVTPCLITIAAAGTQVSYEWAEEIRQEIISSMRQLTPNLAPITTVRVPCGGSISSLFTCHGHGVPEAIKLLVLIGDPTKAFQDVTEYERWASQGPTYRVLPVLPAGAPVASLLPPSLIAQQNPMAQVSLRNAAFWQTRVTEAVPEILATAGLTSTEQRIFISYYRPDTQALADQLFDALSHVRFDVYLDRFRTPPAADFRLRIEQELVDKSMVLVLESTNLPHSKWCAHEITTAQRQRLGLLALQMPNGANMTGIAPAQRMRLATADFTNRATLETLNNPSLQQVVQRIRLEHDRMLVFRRNYLRRSLELAIQFHGGSNIQDRPDGLLGISSNRNSRTYAVWLTPRCPDLPDFQKTDVGLQGGDQGIVVGPGVVETHRRDRLDWLSQKSNLMHVDEGRMFRLAEEMVKGRL